MPRLVPLAFRPVPRAAATPFNGHRYLALRPICASPHSWALIPAGTQRTSRFGSFGCIH
ncbi:hypothetical protein CBM2587_P20033 [Cupriavidus taiwanensis]|uniref:Uncharacterized protein n=1 Tax=Cupriavidus taiwanensis TaxID=164546 RepID=A0A975XIX6_9BURK|nr:hypothetical protein CBM2587_P20033 [Cupriavidus taiwanensis]